MTKILIIANHFVTLQAFRSELIGRLLNDGCDVYLSLPASDENKYFEEIGCRVLMASIDRRGVNPVKDLILTWNYYRILRSVKPDIVLSYTIKPNIYGGIACQLTKTPYCPNVTGLGTSVKNPGLLQKLTVFLYKLGLRGASCVFVQNSDNAEFLKTHGIQGAKQRLLPGSGVNLEKNLYRQYPNSNAEIRFLTVGRIMRDKGIDELLACAKEIHSRYPNTKFSLAGMYDDESYTEKIQIAVDAGYLEYLGMRSDVPEMMAQSHCIIHPSYHEGLSNVLLEATACGRPVIASNVPGCRETFDEGLSGFGVEAKSANSLIAAVERFLTLSQEERETMGVHGRKKVEQEFDRKLVVDAYLSEIKRILGE